MCYSAPIGVTQIVREIITLTKVPQPVDRPGQADAAGIPPLWIRAAATFLENYYDEDPSHSEHTARTFFAEIFQRCGAGLYKFPSRKREGPQSIDWGPLTSEALASSWGATPTRARWALAADSPDSDNRQGGW